MVPLWHYADSNPIVDNKTTTMTAISKCAKLFKISSHYQLKRINVQINGFQIKSQLKLNPSSLIAADMRWD